MSRATQDTGRLRQGVAYGIITLYDAPFQALPLPWSLATSRSYNPGIAETTPVWAIPVSLATTPRIVIYFLFLNLLRCFSSVGSHYITYVFSYEQHDMTRARFPHSEISGS